jgi:hypothetical protein
MWSAFSLTARRHTVAERVFAPIEASAPKLIHELEPKRKRKPEERPAVPA